MMLVRFALIALFCSVISTPSYAGLADLLLMTEEEEAAYLEDGVGARGRYTRDQSELLAWRAIEYAHPVEVLGYDAKRNNNHFYYHYRIVVEDGSIYQVEINAGNGKLYEIEAELLSANPVLPDGALDEDSARSLALSYVTDKMKGMGREKLLGSTLQVYRREIVYAVQVKKSRRIYDVMVDVRKGRVIDSIIVD